GKYILFLNPDTLVPEDCFEKCMDFLETHKDAGALGIRMLDGSGNFLKESKRSFPSPLTSLYKLSGLTRLFPRSKVFARYYLGNLEENKNQEVDVLAGAFMMIPKKIIDTTGNFDEQFFMYGEDIDLSYRIQKSGYKNYYFAGSTILHFKGESTRKGNLNFIKMFYNAMLIFVKKHYGGSKAGFFYFFIKAAILIRALISAAAKFIRWIGMPVIDASIILFSFWAVKFIWNIYIKTEVNYSTNLLLIAFPVFTLIFLVASFFSGLYDKGYRQSRLNRSSITAMVLLLAGYSLLPENLRFSRGILFFGSLFAWILLALLRHILVSSKIIEGADKTNENRQTIIVGSKKEYEQALAILKKAGMSERVLGRVDSNGNTEGIAIGNLGEMKTLLKKYPVKEVIFCVGELTFKKTIEMVSQLPANTRIKFHADCSQSIIGSDSKNISGDVVSADTKFRVAMPVNRRNKVLTDISISVLMLITFPLHLILQKNRSRFFNNIASVLAMKKSFVGYASHTSELPVLIPGILTTTTLPASMNTLPQESLHAADKWYATHYNTWYDVRIIWKGYKYLSK
ncbi:MAG: glycosyltransferase, partial [Chitinophagaceae bacterium]|nr:glycosyltransferase [Chitinophagaceae bacterium]